MTTVYIYDNPEREYVWDAIESVKTVGLPFIVVTNRKIPGVKTAPRTNSYAKDIADVLKEDDDAIILEDDDILVRRPIETDYSYHAKPFVWIENTATRQAVMQAFENVTKAWHNVSSFFINEKDIPKLKDILRRYNKSYGLDKVIQVCLKVTHIDNPLYSFTAWRFHDTNVSLVKTYSFYAKAERELNEFLRTC